ncbi:MAG: ABC transporter ATP-binding protein [Rhodospirillaceae bacterium]|nr:ABC transporter ATP-binding protein [Rhodospirillaceae bacterium]
MVRLDGVTKRFGDVAAAEDVSFELGQGEFLTILGPSGSGKTTVLRMIAGFMEPTAGTILLGGRPVGALPPHRRSIGMVFQRLALFPHMTAAGNIAYPLRMRGFPRDEIPARVERYLGLVQLAGLGDRRIHELSGGQQQRVAIARALSFEPDLLLLDEPLASLDRKLREDMQLEFRRIQQELGVATINVTHDQREALVMSDRVIVMDGGRIQQAAAPETAYRLPANRFVAGFIGVTNFLPCAVRRSADGEAEVAIGDTVCAGRCAAPLPAGAPAEAALRAEQVLLGEAGQPIAHADMVVPATVTEVIFEGDRVVYAVHAAGLGGALLRIFDHDPLHHKTRRIGEDVAIGWKRRDLMVFPRDT